MELGLLMSSAAEEEEEAAAIETVKSVALSQEREILHCPHNDEDSEPLQKKMHLSSEEQDDSDPAEFSVILQEEEEDCPCPDQKSEVSPVSQAWFTTKEDKDTLTNKGIEDPAEIIFEMSKEERKDFYRSVALGFKPAAVRHLQTSSPHVRQPEPRGEAEGETRERLGDDRLGSRSQRLFRKWTEEEERRLAEVVYEMSGVKPGLAVTGGVSWATVADLVRTRSEKQCRILELQVEEENEIKWEDLAGGWSSVRSPQWLRSKWWSIKRQVSNHKEIPFNVLLKGLRELIASSQSGSPSSSSSSSLQIRFNRLDESSGSPAPSSVAALQIPVQITHLDSSAAANDSETITGALQTFEILPSFHLQPTGTPGTYFLQTTSNQGLSLGNNSTVTLTTGSSPSSHNTSSCTACRLTASVLRRCHHPNDPLSQSQLEEEGRNQEDRLGNESLLEGSVSVVTETQEPITEGFIDKELSSPSGSRADCVSKHQQHPDSVAQDDRKWKQFVNETPGLIVKTCQRDSETEKDVTFK
ncbi:hypothetical protein F7725_022079 [Dissostichus mawsoni]|uniref:Myb-like domain-containing protein n=1 Tax=Dissostichus mawsoni TaxID=36200 RepID=A0A7J5ZDM5_DISMA|nr:hypothetical protein F7725_022079 [Dissostichus mawsoni]